MATGMDMLLGTVIRSLGIDPAEANRVFVQSAQMIAETAARMDRIEARLNAICDKLGVELSTPEPEAVQALAQERAAERISNGAAPWMG